MPVSFYLISTLVFSIIVFIFYRAAIAYAKKDLDADKIKPGIRFLGVLRPVLPLSVVATVAVMLGVRYFFY
jgi:hypothetical protein